MRALFVGGLLHGAAADYMWATTDGQPGMSKAYYGDRVRIVSSLQRTPVASRERREDTRTHLSHAVAAGRFLQLSGRRAGA